MVCQQPYSLDPRTVSRSEHSHRDRVAHQLSLSAQPPSLAAASDYLCHDSLPWAEITEERPQSGAHACKTHRAVLTHGAA